MCSRERRFSMNDAVFFAPEEGVPPHPRSIGQDESNPVKGTPARTATPGNPTGARLSARGRRGARKRSLATRPAERRQKRMVPPAEGRRGSAHRPLDPRGVLRNSGPRGRVPRRRCWRAALRTPCSAPKWRNWQTRRIQNPVSPKDVWVRVPPSAPPILFQGGREVLSRGVPFSPPVVVHGCRVRSPSESPGRSCKGTRTPAAGGSGRHPCGTPFPEY